MLAQWLASHSSKKWPIPIKVKAKFLSNNQNIQLQNCAISLLFTLLLIASHQPFLISHLKKGWSDTDQGHARRDEVFACNEALQDHPKVHSRIPSKIPPVYHLHCLPLLPRLGRPPCFAISNPLFSHSSVNRCSPPINLRICGLPSAVFSSHY